ncbi:hypothetical protein Bbelb_188070 [Branchiostoma belcheri]|nr:hypothetical protein Bbelb_188070 [Branchiostoma belcheri]
MGMNMQIKIRICIATEEKISRRSAGSEFQRVVMKLQEKSNARGVVLFANEDDLQGILSAARNLSANFSWVGSDAWGSKSAPVVNHNEEAEGAITILLKKVNIPDMSTDSHVNRLKPKVEEILTEEQAGLRAGRSTLEQIFNIRMLTGLKAFDRVWHEGLWKVMRDYNIDESLVAIIKSLYDNATCAVLHNNQLGDIFRTTVGVRQGCLLSPALFNVFLENIMQEALTDFESSISIGGRQLSNLRFADDIDLMAGSEDEHQDLSTRVDSRSTAYGMEVSTSKSKGMINGPTPDARTTVSMGGEVLEDVDSFKYLGSILNREGTSTQEIRARIAQATAALAKLSPILQSKNISLPVKINLYKSLVASIFLYGCESWTTTAEAERRIEAFEMKCLRRILGISYLQRRTNESVRQEVEEVCGKQQSLLSTVKQRKLMWFGHVCRYNTLAKTILQGTVAGGRKRGRPRKTWLDNIKKWTGLSVP